MAASTGPDLNTYTIPEVELGDTFNYWRDTTNTTIYKLNKLKIYDAVDSVSIGATYGSTGAWRALLQPTITSGHTFSTLLTLSGGLTTSYLFVSGGTTLGSTLVVNGGATFASISDFTGLAKFATGVCAANLRVTSGSTLSGSVWLGNPSAGSVVQARGEFRLRESTPLKFYDSDASNYLALQSPSVVSSDITWTLPSTDGTNGFVLSTNGSGILSWKAADGVTGSDTQVQYNQGGAPGATSSFLFHYNSSGGYSAGTLGVSGGAYILGNVGVGVTGQNIGSRTFGGSTYAKGKIDIVGDIRIQSGGFFVNKSLTIPAGVCASIGTDENAFAAGIFTVASGATLTIETNGYLVIL